MPRFHPTLQPLFPETSTFRPSDQIPFVPLTPGSAASRHERVAEAPPATRAR